MDVKAALSITFGECVETHAGMQQTGTIRDVGYSVEELRVIHKNLSQNKVTSELIMLSDVLPDELQKNNEAAVLVIKDGLNLFGVNKNDLYAEQINLEHDKKAFMKGRVVNKLARHNLCYADFDQQPNYEKGMGTIIGFEHLPVLNEVRTNLSSIFGPKSNGLFAELNVYFDEKKCGIGFHGDTERKIVICVRLGRDNPLQYQWFHRSKPVYSRMNVNLSDGDIYIMSDKAVGHDWKKSSLYTLRHAAGAAKYLKTKHDSLLNGN